MISGPGSKGCQLDYVELKFNKSRDVIQGHRCACMYISGWVLKRAIGSVVESGLLDGRVRESNERATALNHFQYEIFMY